MEWWQAILTVSIFTHAFIFVLCWTGVILLAYNIREYIKENGINYKKKPINKFSFVYGLILTILPIINLIFVFYISINEKKITNKVIENIEE